MGKRIRRNYDESFKTKVVLEVLKEQKTLAQLSSEFDLHATQIGEWRKQVVSGIPSLFAGKKTIISEEEKEDLTAPLYQQIGQLKVELDYLKKRLRKDP
jgi:transposase-like protein